MTPEEAAVATRPEAEEAVPVEALLDAEETEEEEDFSPLGKIEGWSAYECASGPFGFRG